MTPAPWLSIVILCRDRREHLMACLESHQQHHDAADHEIIVVDNASSDGTIDALRQRFPEVQRIANDEDKGFAQGNNQGLARASGECVLFLNPDTRFLSSDIARLRDRLRAQPDIGLIGCRLRNPDHTPQDSCARFPTLRGLALRATLGRTAAGQRLAARHAVLAPHLARGSSPDRLSEVDWVLGAFMLGRRDVLTGLGGFDEDYWYYGTDLDLCWKVHASALRVVYDPAYEIVHFGNPVWDAERLRAVRQSQHFFFRKRRGALRALALDLAYRAPPARPLRTSTR